jgi:hypothetical protein
MRKKKKGKWQQIGRGLKTGCLALGMATAWGGEARSDVICEVSVRPTVALTDAWVFYGVNCTSGAMESLGALPANQTTVRTQSLTGYTPDNVWQDGRLLPYMLVGLYDDGGTPGVVVSFASGSAMPDSWTQVFGSSPHSYYNYTEEEVIQGVHAASTDPYGTLFWFMCDYGSGYSKPCATEYNQPSMLVGFSDPFDAGTATVRVVPEPSTFVLVLGAAGVFLLRRRRESQ